MESSKVKMRFLLIFLLSFLLYNVSLQAQGEYEEDYTFEGMENKKFRTGDAKNAVFKLSFLWPEIGTEFSLSSRFSLDIAGKLGINPSIIQNGASQKLILSPYPVFHIEPKWNYNILKREKRGKRIDGFSSNFLSLYTSYRIKVGSFNNHALLIGPTWGIQRMMGSIGYFKLNLGLGYFQQFNPTPSTAFPQGLLPVIPIVDVKLGILF